VTHGVAGNTTAGPRERARPSVWVRGGQPRQRSVTGIRQSFPNARGLTFTPGGIWRRFHSETATMCAIRRTVVSSNPIAAISAIGRSSST